MNAKLLHYCDDTEFGKGAPYAWPGDFEEAKKFLNQCTFIESSGECLECDFYDEDDSEDVRERFKGVTEWPLPYLVASAVYYFLEWRSRIGERIWNVRRIDVYTWGSLFSVLLAVGEPLFQMIHRNGWGEPNKEFIREGFRLELESVIRLDDCRTPYRQIQWFCERGTSWFQIGAKKGRVSPENLLGCLKLASTNETVARLAVKEVFETETLYPFYTALLFGTDTDFAASPPANNGEGGSMATLGHRGERENLTQSTVFKAALAIVFANVFCLPRLPLVSRALSFYRNFHSVALANQPRPPFGMITFRSTLPVKMTTGDVQEIEVCSHVKVVRRFTGRVVTPLSLSESKLKSRAHRPIKLGCFANLRPDEDNENIDSVRLVPQQIPFYSPNGIITTILDGESIESLFTHPDEDVVYPEYCHEVMEDLEQVSLDKDDPNESNSQSDSDSVADSLVDPISLEEIRQLVPVEGPESSQPLVRDPLDGRGWPSNPEYTSASHLTAVLHVSEATQSQEITDRAVVEIEPLFEEFPNVPLSKEAKEYLAKQPLRQFPRTKSRVEEAGLDLDRLLSSYSSVDSNGEARVRRGFVAVKHLRLTEDSPELAALQQDLPIDAKINVVVTIQRGKGGVGKIARIALDGTVCPESGVKKIATLFKDRFEIDGQKHPIAPFEKNHLTLTPVGLPYDLRSKGTNELDQTFVMLLPKGLHRLHTQWWQQTYNAETQDAVPRYNFRSFYQTVEDFYSATREHDCDLWLKHEDQLAAYGLTPQGLIEATKYGQHLDNMMMNRKIMSEWSQKGKTNKTKQVPAFVLNKGIIHAATQTSESYRREFQLPVPNEIGTREMYKSFTPDQREAVIMSYNRKIREARLVKGDGLYELAEYYGKLHNLAHHLELLSGFPEADREGVTMNQIAEHSKTRRLVSDIFSALINRIVTNASFKEELTDKMKTWKNPTVTETLLPGSKPSTNESIDNVVTEAESLSMHFTHKTKTENFSIRSNARDSQALLKECVLEVNQMAQKITKEKEKRGYYFGGGRTL